MAMIKSNLSCLDSLSRGNNCLPARNTSPGVAATLAGVLIFTTVADILGNLLVILSVYRNKKLRNAGVKTSVMSGKYQTLYDELLLKILLFFTFFSKFAEFVYL